MKKLIKLFLSLTMVLSFISVSFAEDIDHSTLEEEHPEYVVHYYTISGTLNETYRPNITNVNAVDVTYKITGMASEDSSGNITIDSISATVKSVTVGYFGSGSYTYSVTVNGLDYYLSGNTIYVKARANIQVNGTTKWNQSPLGGYVGFTLV